MAILDARISVIGPTAAYFIQKKQKFPSGTSEVMHRTLHHGSDSEQEPQARPAHIPRGRHVDIDALEDIAKLHLDLRLDAIHDVLGWAAARKRIQVPGGEPNQLTHRASASYLVGNLRPRLIFRHLTIIPMQAKTVNWRDVFVWIG
jgi:hypothetical protein